MLRDVQCQNQLPRVRRQAKQQGKFCSQQTNLPVYMTRQDALISYSSSADKHPSCVIFSRRDVMKDGFAHPDACEYIVQSVGHAMGFKGLPYLSAPFCKVFPSCLSPSLQRSRRVF